MHGIEQSNSWGFSFSNERNGLSYVSGVYSGFYKISWILIIFYKLWSSILSVVLISDGNSSYSLYYFENFYISRKSLFYYFYYVNIN